MVLSRDTISLLILVRLLIEEKPMETWAFPIGF